MEQEPDFLDSPEGPSEVVGSARSELLRTDLPLFDFRRGLLQFAILLLPESEWQARTLRWMDVVWPRTTEIEREREAKGKEREIGWVERATY